MQVDAEEVILEENEDDLDHEELEEEKKEAQRQVTNAKLWNLITFESYGYLEAYTDYQYIFVL